MKAGPSTKTPRFDPLQMLREIQSEPSGSGSTHARDETSADQDDDDFMSDKYLPTIETKQPLTYSDKRRRLEAHHSSKAKPHKSIKEREEEARKEGLDRDLLAEAEIVAGGGRLPPEGRDGMRRWDLMDKQDAVGERDEDGTTKAMRMMLAMGYRRGEALGRRMQGSTGRGDDDQEVEEEEDEEEYEGEPGRAPHSILGGMDAALTSPPDDADSAPFDSDEERIAQKERDNSQERAEDEYLTGGDSTTPFTAGHESTTRIAHPSLEPLRPDQRWLGFHRRAGIGMIPKTTPTISAAIRDKASSSTSNATSSQSKAELDFRTRISSEHSQRHNANLLSRARQTLIHLDQSSCTKYSPLWLNTDVYRLLTGQMAASVSDATIDERMQIDASFREAVELLQSAFSSGEQQRQEAKVFVELETREQLELVLECLRRDHRYCLFCGCQYASAEEFKQGCPGEAEEDHD